MRPRSNLLLVLIVPIVIVTMAVPAGATALLYTDRAGWEAATMGLFTIDFEGLATPASPGYYNTPAGLTLSGVNFIGLTPPDSYYLFVEDPGGSPNYNWASGDLLMGPGWGNEGHIEANLPAGVTSVAADLMTHTPFAATVVVSLSTGETFTIPTQSNPNRTFVGFTSSVPISYIRFTPQAGFPMIDNFSYGTSGQITETPEIETLILATTGLLGFLLARWLRRWT